MLAVLAEVAAPPVPEPLAAFELPDLELGAADLEIDASTPVQTAASAAVDMLEFDLAAEAADVAPAIEVVEVDAADQDALLEADFAPASDPIWDGPVETVEAAALASNPTDEVEPAAELPAMEAPAAETPEAIDAEAPMLALDLAELDFATAETPPAPTEVVQVVDQEGEASVDLPMAALEMPAAEPEDAPSAEALGEAPAPAPEAKAPAAEPAPAPAPDRKSTRLNSSHT